MAELTQQDRENYDKLRKAATDLKSALSPLVSTGNPKLIKDLFSALESQLPKILKTIDELEGSLDRIDSYLVAQKFLLDTSSLTEEQQNAIAQATQELRNQADFLKASLQDIEDADLSALDDLNSPCVDALFMKFLPKTEKDWTEKLLDGRLSTLENNKVQQLTDAWGTAIFKVAEDARQKGEKDGKLIPGELDTIFSFFCIHEELEALYDRLSALTT